MKHARVVFGISALGAMLSLAACAQTIAPSATMPSEAATAPAAVTGAWKLQSLTRPDATVVPISEPDRFTVEFTAGSNRISLRADCNRGFGSFSANGNSISVSPVAITKAYCAETAPLDDEYVRLLAGDNVVTATDSSLQLASSRGTLRFIK